MFNRKNTIFIILVFMLIVAVLGNAREIDRTASEIASDVSSTLLNI